MNCRYSSGYRSYSKDLPLWLHDRHKELIDHILPRLTPDSKLVDSVQFLSEGVFQVRSEAKDRAPYKLSYGNESTYPKCECPHWRRYKLPCKHFCAIFQGYPNWGWERFPNSYKNHPLSSIDYDCANILFRIVSEDDNKEDEGISIEIDICNESTPLYLDNEKKPLELPQRLRSKYGMLQLRCRSVLREMINLTYMLKDL